MRDVLCLNLPRILHANRSMYGTPALLGSMLYVAMRMQTPLFDMLRVDLCCLSRRSSLARDPPPALGLVG